MKLTRKVLVVEDPNTTTRQDHDGLEIFGVFDTVEQAIREIRSTTQYNVDTWGESEGFHLGVDPDFASHFMVYEFVCEVVPEVNVKAVLKFAVSKELPKPRTSDKDSGEEGYGHAQSNDKTEDGEVG